MVPAPWLCLPRSPCSTDSSEKTDEQSAECDAGVAAAAEEEAEGVVVVVDEADGDGDSDGEGDCSCATDWRDADGGDD